MTDAVEHVTGAAARTEADRLPELSREIDLQMLVRYAGASGDYNPIHYDEAFARQNGLDGIIGHGMLALAFVGQVITEWIGDSGLVQRLSARFINPCRPGDRLTLTGAVKDRGVDDDGRESIELELRCTNQDGVEIIGNAEATVLSPTTKERA